jgi:hypothetical protein
MKLINLILIVLLFVIATSCAILKDPEITKRENIDNYSFVVLPKTNSLTSETGGVYGNQYGVYGGSTTKEMNPGQVIEGIFLKRGLVSTDSVNTENKDKTLIVKYGESGKRNVAGGLGGYTLEVTIALISAKTNSIVYSCVAEGQGETEVDDIREAIHRCLSGL